jgi:DNA-binding GntR family transcriptional regulator
VPEEPDLTTGERAYRRIRGDILMGQLKPGQKLTLERMRDRYATSVSTLREILSRLEAERLVVAEGQRGFHVSPISLDDLRELASLRVLLEGHALAQSFAAGDTEWEGRVVSAHHMLSVMEERVAAGDRGAVESWKRYDWQFHQTLISACGSKTLVETHAAVFDRYIRYQILALSHRGAISANEHHALLECALARDAARAREVLIAHIGGGVEHAIAAGTIG